MQNQNYTEADFAAMIQGLTLAISFLIVNISKHPGVDTGLLLSDWQEMTEKLKKQSPQTTAPLAFDMLRQFETMIKQQVRPNSF